MNGERDFDALWREEGPRLWRALLVYAGGRRDVADDAVAEAFARTMERGGAVREPVPYLYRVAFRIAAAEIKRESAHGEQEDRAVTDAVGDVDLLTAIRSLSADMRAVVFLHYRYDMPVAQVASLVGSNSTAVRVRLMRARRKLRALLEEGPE